MSVVVPKLKAKARSVRRTCGLFRDRLRKSRNRIWVKCQLPQTAKRKGYNSLSSLRRGVQVLRQEEGYGLEFCIVFTRTHRDKKTKKYKKGHWDLMVALASNLRWDKQPYHRDAKGRPRHTRRHLWHVVNDWMGELPHEQSEKQKELGKKLPTVAQVFSEKKIESVIFPLPSTLSGVFTDSADKNNSASHSDYRGPPYPTSNRSPLRPSSTVKKLWNRKLQRKTAWTVSEMERQQRRSGIKVGFSNRNAYTFARDGLHKGFKDWELIRTWIKAAETTYVDTSDGLTRSEPALLLFHARRILALRDKLTDQERVQNFYSSIVKSQQKEPLIK